MREGDARPPASGQDVRCWSEPGSAAYTAARSASFRLASGRYLMTTAVLRAQGRVPPHLLSFLDDAHRLGILRQAGPVYQFRHAKLHDHLAQTYAHPT